MMATCEVCKKDSETCEPYGSLVICKGCFFAISSRFVNREKRIGRKLTPEEKVRIIKSYMADIGREGCDVKLEKNE